MVLLMLLMLLLLPMLLMNQGWECLRWALCVRWGAGRRHAAEAATA